VLRRAAPLILGRVELIRAIEENAAELLLRMGAAGGGEQRDDAKVRWTIGGSPIDYHNAVVAADLSDDEADHVIVESIRRFEANGVPGSWHVGPSMRPSDLGDRLLAAGFSYGGSEPGMAVDLTRLTDPRPTDPTQPADPTRPTDASRPSDPTPVLRIVRVQATDVLATWAATLAQGFGEGPKEAEWVAEVYRSEGFDDPWRHYLAYRDDEPVATATVFLAAGVAGVYFVMTVPTARRQGIGAAITLHALREARDSGIPYAVLGSSPAGRSVYESLGFKTYCEIDLYEWGSGVPAVDGWGAAFPA
jgi:GNAT superfamily N-acetyltransferase